MLFEKAIGEVPRQTPKITHLGHTYSHRYPFGPPVLPGEHRISPFGTVQGCADALLLLPYTKKGITLPSEGGMKGGSR